MLFDLQNMSKSSTVPETMHTSLTNAYDQRLVKILFSLIAVKLTRYSNVYLSFRIFWQTCIFIFMIFLLFQIQRLICQSVFF